MGMLWESVKKGWNEGKSRAQFEGTTRRLQIEFNGIVKIVEPNYGRIVTIRVLSDKGKDLYISQIKTYAEAIDAKIIKASDAEVTFECPDFSIAEICRKTLGK